MPDKPEVEPKDFDIDDLPGTKLLIELDGPTSFLLGQVVRDSGFRSRSAYVRDLIARSVLEHVEVSDIAGKTEALIEHFKGRTASE